MGQNTIRPAAAHGRISKLLRQALYSILPNAGLISPRFGAVAKTLQRTMRDHDSRTAEARLTAFMPRACVPCFVVRGKVMRPLHLSAFLCVVSSVAVAQPALVELPEFPQVLPGPQAVYGGSKCFLLAEGVIFPGDVDWIGVRIPRASSQTVIDVDFPAGTSGSALLAMVVNGATGFNIGDNNNTRDALCGMNAASSPVGSLRDSVVDLRATSINATIHIAVTGAADTSFVGLHSANFAYEVWVYALPYPCANDVSCDDGVGCTVDQCDVVTGDCSNSPQDTACVDGFFCNGAERCDGAFGCRAGPRPTCNDNVGCTDDYCDMWIDQCVFEPVDEWCENGLFCDGNEFCDAQSGCQAGPPFDCNDNVGCTIDSCNEEQFQCVHTAADDACDDGQFCNGAEQCDFAMGCMAGTVPCPGSMCRESDDQCVECLADSDCDDGAFCNGGEFCSAAGICEAGGVPCGTGLCRESDDRCVECLADADCNDEQFCNGDELCQSAGACAAGAPPCLPGQLCNETTAECVISEMSMDVRPGVCPARVMVSARGQLPIALVGADVELIDVTTVRLSRVDGVGTSLPPMQGPPGPGPRFDDVSGRAEACVCSGAAPDGFDDLVMPFDLEKVVQLLRLGAVRGGTQVELRLTGSLLDGTPFTATDCVTIQSTGRIGSSAAQ